MIPDTLETRLVKERPMACVTVCVPKDVVESLKAVAPRKGLSGHQARMQSFANSRSPRAQPSRTGWIPGGTGWLREARRVPSPNHDERPPLTAIELLVVHHISLPPGRFRGDAIERLFMNRLDPDSHPAFAPLRDLCVSAHFLIRRNGGLLQFVDTDRRAWHAGVSSFAGRERCNDFSIGVELEGDGVHRFTAAQYRALRRLLGRLRERYPLRSVAGHSDIAPGRKHDPGPRFDWPRLLRARQANGMESAKRKGVAGCLSAT